MKKIFKLFLCMLMLFSFTNVTKVLAEGGENEFVSVSDVVNRYDKTGFIRLLMMEAPEDADLTVNLDEVDHKINLISKNETFMSYDYNDEYISLHGTAPESAESIDLGEILGQMIYTENMLYAVLDVMGYNDKDVEIAEDIETNEEFFNEYGLYLKEGEYSFGSEESEEGYTRGTYIEELRISLSKEKIAALVKDFGEKRIDYDAIADGKVIKPEIIVKKKDNNIKVSWEEVYNATKYDVYRATSKTGKYTKIGSTTKTSYTDKKVTYGKTYYYKVKAIGKKNSKTSDIKSLKLIPDKVKNVNLTKIKNNSIKINYDKVSANGYVIERSTDGKKWSTIKTITKNSTLSYTNTKLKANKTYYYRVKAYKLVGRKAVYGKASEVVSAKTAPATPTLTVKTNTYDSLKLTVGEVKGAKTYVLYRATKKDGEYENLNEIDTTFINQDLKYGKTYYYKVKACNAENKCSGYSKVVSAKVELKKPSLKLEAPKTSPLMVKVSGLTAVEGYVLYRSTDKKKWDKIGTFGSGDNVYEDKTAKKNKTYYYRVKTFVTINENKVYSAYSDVKSIKCLYTVSASTPEVQTRMAQSVLEFVGIYKKGNDTLKIFSISEENNMVEYDGTKLGSSYNMEYDNGELNTEFFDKLIRIQIIDNGVKVSGSSENENGIYTRVSEYTFDDFFEDKFGSDYMDTKYNGYFDDGHDQTLKVFQNEEDKVLLSGVVNGNDHIDIYLTIDENMAVGTLFDDRYELEINDGVLTIRRYVNDSLTYEKTLSRVRDLTKEEIVETYL